MTDNDETSLGGCDCGVLQCQVCDWVEYLGLPYRKRFLHHLVDGRIAMQLTNNDLKARCARR